MFTKQKLSEMFLTALLSAGIAFLQSFISYLSHLPAIDNSVQTSAILGAVIHAFR